ncbi:RcnB family protein [Caldimonas aquatica]|uniref:RcnB family protein n=1 Tax=Caldimonas aquatica TaxID=376175 RepID=A0ABY6MPN0_9BURK|nr:RcnB family protein [Schlegelella aquatica]UZD53860.1 RcnB family protein [Schlegelella aquatica]
MQARTLIALATLALGLQAGLAHAQPRDRHAPAPRVEHRHGPVHGHPAARPAHPPVVVVQPVRVAAPRHHFHRGARLPVAYRHHVVHDWRAHRLSAPPRGHHWVRVGSDFVLVAAATGIIAHFVLAH